MTGSSDGVATVQAFEQGVGERHTQPPTPHGQGGYLGNCNNPKSALREKNFSSDDKKNIKKYNERADLQQVDLFWLETGPKILTEHHVPVHTGKAAPSIPPQFTDISLPPLWQRIAAHIGAESFLELMGLMWDFAPRDGDRQRIDVPSRETFTRLYRNGMIRQCAAQGLNSSQTARTLAQHKLDVSESTISRVLKFLPLE